MSGTPGLHATDGGETRGVLERSRLRTWETEAAADARPAWRIIAKYAGVRMVRTWWISTLLVVIGVGLLLYLGSLTYEVAEGRAWSKDDVSLAFMSTLLPSLLLALLVAAPLFAEDLRFNAPLFYFSRPVARTGYVHGKAAFLGALLGLVTVVPLALALLMVLFTAPFAAPPDTIPAEDLGEWRTAHVDTFVDALFVLVLALAGAVAILAFLGSAALLASAYTRRGWHAALALLTVVGLWGMLGLMAADFTRTAPQHLFGPFGWAYLLLEMPFSLRFTKPLAAAPDPYLREYEHAEASIAAAYLIVCGLAALFFLLARRRILRQGESL